MDVLTLKGLRYFAPHGYFVEERLKGNTFEVDVLFYADLKKRGKPMI